jgi:hypothetical protein
VSELGYLFLTVQCAIDIESDLNIRERIAFPYLMEDVKSYNINKDLLL